MMKYLQLFAPRILAFAVVLPALVLARPAPGLGFDPFGSSSKDAYVRLGQLSPKLQPYEDQDGRDFVLHEFDYSKLGEREFDPVFKDIAHLAADAHQIRSVLEHYEEKGEAALGSNEDVAFYFAMVAHAIQVMPKFGQRVERVQKRLEKLDVGRLQNPLNSMKLPASLNRAREQLQIAVALAAKTKDVYKDYKQMESDLESWEEL